MIVFTANGRCAKIKTAEPITTGSVGMPVSVVLSGDFDGLATTMVFACGDVSADVPLMGQEVTVPPQVLEEAGRVLEIGVYGARADGTIVIPTVWAKAGIVHEGVLPSGVDPAEPTPSWVAQVQQWAENAHDTAEQLAQDVESWEAEIDTAIENARDATQDATQTAASIAQAESSRATAESSRAAAESARVTAEASRATAEQSRAAAESSRAESEQGRVTAETARVSAESARATAETTRATAEQSRATAETARASAESVRVTAEQGRASAENARASAESARATAESARASAETSRANAETARSNAESTRASEWATVKAEAEDATSAAESAASDATAAAAEARAASAATWLSGNVLFGELEEAAVLTTDDTYSAPPKGVEVFGVSTQAGTPTPDAPVPIESVDDLTLMIRGKNLLGLTDTTEVTQNGVTYSAANNVISISGTPTADFDIRFLPKDVKERYHFTAGEKVSFSSDNVPSNVRVTIMHQGGGGICDLPTNNVTINPVWLYVGAIRLRFTSGSAVNASFSIQMEQGAAATTFEPYVGTSTAIPLSNHELRSLPDGTRDALTLSYQGPSTEHEGWGVFVVELLQKAGLLTVSNLANGTVTTSSGSPDYTYVYSGAYDALVARSNQTGYCDKLTRWTADNTVLGADKVVNTDTYTFGGKSGGSYLRMLILKSRLSSVSLAGVNAWLAENQLTFVYPLATPITHNLGEVELPILPNPLTAWADGGSAQPTLAMVYEQDINIVIARLKDTIADMATS